ncbi:acylphosphatase [Nitriliruptoraceae bacterium ZYF776]|nr:acylphosphatase [Profundirhabdus halotolerans]
MAPRPVAQRVVVHGHVQGVYFRAATRQQARRHGVAGWVRNRADGTVEVWLEGDADAVESVEAWIHAGGPPSAEVVRVEVEPGEALGAHGFEVRDDA